MVKLTKKRKEALSTIEANEKYQLADAVDVIKKISYTKFDASVDLDIRLGVARD